MTHTADSLQQVRTQLVKRWKCQWLFVLFQTKAGIPFYTDWKTTSHCLANTGLQKTGKHRHMYTHTHTYLNQFTCEIVKSTEILSHNITGFIEVSEDLNCHHNFTYDCQSRVVVSLVYKKLKKKTQNSTNAANKLLSILPLGIIWGKIKVISLFLILSS